MMKNLQLTKLDALGLSALWLEVAKELGHKEFLELWEKYSNKERHVFYQECKLPMFAVVKRSLVSIYINYLSGIGVSAECSHQFINNKLGIKVSIRKVFMIRKKNEVKEVTKRKSHDFGQTAEGAIVEHMILETLIK